MTDEERPAQANEPAEPVAPGSNTLGPESAGPAAESASPSFAPAGGSPAPELGSIVVIDREARRQLVSAPGDRLVVGGEESAAIRVIDPRVGPRHALIVRQGPGWLVTSLDPGNPIWILDATGRPHPVLEELGLRSGTLLAGGTQIMLYPPGR